jgi:hypothetical protein
VCVLRIIVQQELCVLFWSSSQMCHPPCSAWWLVCGWYLWKCKKHENHGYVAFPANLDQM